MNTFWSILTVFSNLKLKWSLVSDDVSAQVGLSRTETSSAIIAGHGDPIDGSADGLKIFPPGRRRFSSSQGWNYNSYNSTTTNCPAESKRP